MIHVCIVDDEPRTRRALSDSLNAESDFTVVESFDCARSAVERVPALGADIVIMDLAFLNDPGFNGIRGIAEIGAICRARGVPEPRCIAHTLYEENSAKGQKLAREAFRAGAWGYFVKKGDEAELIDGLRRIVNASDRESVAPPLGADRGFLLPSLERLSERERECVLMWAYGRTHKEIAHLLRIAAHTVDVHIRNARMKTGCNSDEALGAAIRGDLNIGAPPTSTGKNQRPLADGDSEE